MCAFWVQFHDIPPEERMEVNVRAMASRLGKVIEVESLEDKRFKARNFYRARVEVDVEKPLVPIFKVLRPEKLEDAKVKVKYEKLVIFYFICGKLGYDDRSYEVEDDDDLANEPRRAYDANMCAQPLRTNQVTPANRGSGRTGNQRRTQGDKRSQMNDKGKSKESEGCEDLSIEGQEGLETEGLGFDISDKVFKFGGSSMMEEDSEGPSIELKELEFNYSEWKSQKKSELGHGRPSILSK